MPNLFTDCSSPNRRSIHCGGVGRGIGDGRGRGVGLVLGVDVGVGVTAGVAVGVIVGVGPEVFLSMVPEPPTIVTLSGSNIDNAL
jgi:hypothetical protein